MVDILPFRLEFSQMYEFVHAIARWSIAFFVVKGWGNKNSLIRGASKLAFFIKKFYDGFVDNCVMQKYLMELNIFKFILDKN